MFPNPYGKAFVSNSTRLRLAHWAEDEAEPAMSIRNLRRRAHVNGQQFFVSKSLPSIWLGLTSLVFAMSSTNAQPPVPDEWLTLAERSDFAKTPRYEDTIAYCRKLAEKSRRLRVTSFGVTPLGRVLPLVVVSKDGEATPANAHADGRVVLFVQNGIHAGEQDGKDGSLMLLRDIALERIDPAVLDHVVLIVIPIFNIDGHERFGPYNRINQNGPDEMGWRTTSRNLNLNRDYMKADAVEMRAWLKLWNEWKPDLHIDTHTTDGGDWQYDVMLAWEKSTSVPAPVAQWMADVMDTALFGKLRDDGHLAVPYFDLIDGKDPTKGVASQAFEPRYSTGYAPLRNRASILVESHMLKPNKTRVHAQYHVQRHVLELAADNFKTLHEANARADAEDLDCGKPAKPVTLSFRRTDASAPFTLKGVSYRLGPSDISGSLQIIYDNSKPQDIETTWLKTIEVDKTVVPPVAYVIPPQWTEAIEIVKAHGLVTQLLKEPLNANAEGYRLQDVKFAERPFEGRFRAQFRAEPLYEKRTFPVGSVVVPVAQLGGDVAIHLLEPIAPDSLATWGFFNLVFEQKEYADGYKLEDLARKMIAENPGLKAEFDAKLAADEKLAADPRARLNFFYQRSRYWDPELGLYPVWRLPQALNQDPTTR
jgi:hypothetical protein